MSNCFLVIERWGRDEVFDRGGALLSLEPQPENCSSAVCADQRGLEKIVGKN